MVTVKILIVEDNPADVLWIKEALEETQGNLAVYHVETLAEATESLRNEDFQAVVLDLGLPDSQGKETFLRLQTSNSEIPIVVISGLDDEALAIEAVRLGAQDYLLKDKLDGCCLSRSINFAIERKKAEKALKETQERFELALSGADLAWWEWNFETEKALADNRATEILGYSPNEVASLRRLWEESTHPDDIAEAEKALSRHIQGDAEAYQIEHRVQTKSEGWKWISVRGRIVKRDASGKPLRMAGTVLDITEVKRAQEALYNSEQQFRLIFEGAQDCIVLKDRSLRFIKVNPAFEKLAGVPASEIIGKTHEDLFGQESADHIREMEMRVLRGETVEDEHAKSIRGVPMRFLATRNPLCEASGKILGIMTTLHDITDRKRNEAPRLPPIKAYPSKAMKTTLNRARTAAKSTFTILLTGESGSGKSHLAKCIHEISRRVNGPFFSMSCAAIAPQIAEQKLFGRNRAFTSSVDKERGLLELADGGTLLLNGIGELSLPLQSKLLNFFHTRKFTRMDGGREISVNTRIMAATNLDLKIKVEEGRFKKELFNHLNVFTLTVPPLRERQEDIPMLVQEILSLIRADLGIHEIPAIDPAAIDTFKRYSWPGNIMELRNVLERAVILSRGKDISALKLEFLIPTEETATCAPLYGKKSLDEMTKEFRRSAVDEALRQSKGSTQGAAKLLGISQRSVTNYIRKPGHTKKK